MGQAIPECSGPRKSFAPLIAGLAGGTVSTTLLLPLDNIKVRLQVHEGDSTGKSNRLSSIRLIRGVLRHEGVAGFWQGLTPAVIGLQSRGVVSFSFTKD